MAMKQNFETLDDGTVIGGGDTRADYTADGFYKNNMSITDAISSLMGRGPTPNQGAPIFAGSNDEPDMMDINDLNFTGMAPQRMNTEQAAAMENAAIRDPGPAFDSIATGKSGSAPTPQVPAALANAVPKSKPAMPTPTPTPTPNADPNAEAPFVSSSPFINRLTGQGPMLDPANQRTLLEAIQELFSDVNILGPNAR